MASAAAGGEFAFFSTLPEPPGFADSAMHLPKALSQCI